MSQFLVIVGDKPAAVRHPGVRSVDLAQAQEAVREVAQALLSPDEQRSAWSPMDAAGDTDELFTEAHAQLHDGVKLQQTRLGQLLNAVLPTVRCMLFWYSDGWQDLPLVGDQTSLLAQLEADVLSEFCEVHLRYRPVAEESQTVGPAGG